MRVGVAVPIVFSFCGFIQTADAADTSWHNVRAAGDPSVTIDIPAEVSQRADLDFQNSEVMEFSGSSGSHVDILCMLHRNEYPPALPQKGFAAMIGSNVSSFCTEDGVSDFHALSSGPAVSNGYLGGICTSSFTDSAKKKPGFVKAVLAVSAPKAAYFLECNMMADDQHTARGYWDLELREFFAHLQSSLHISSNGK